MVKDVKASLDQKCLKLVEEIRILDLECRETHQYLHQLQTNQHELMSEINDLRQVKTKLELEGKKLRKQKRSLECHIKSALDFLNGKLEGIVTVVQNSPESSKKIKSKKFDAQGRWKWLPWRAYDVLAKNVKELVVALSDFLKIIVIRPSRSPDYSDDAQLDDEHECVS